MVNHSNPLYVHLLPECCSTQRGVAQQWWVKLTKRMDQDEEDHADAREHRG